MLTDPVATDASQRYAERHFALPARLTGDAVTGLRSRLLGCAADPAVLRLVVDGRDVEELAPYAMTVLIAASRAIREHGGELVMVHPNSIVSEALQRLGLNKVLTIVQDDFPPRPWSELQ